MAASPAPDTTLRWGINEPSAIVPMDATSAEDLLVVDGLFDSLTAWDDQLRPVPAAAARWDTPDGGRTWRFRLRPGATFHDGSPVTAGSFIGAWSEQARRGAAHHHLKDVVGYRQARGGRRGPLRGLRALNAGTLRVRLRAPDWNFPVNAGHPALGPVPVSAATDPGFRQRPVGNGPFRMAEPWAHGSFVRLTRAAPPPADTDAPGRPLDEVVFRIQDPVGAYLAYEQGRLDVATLPPGALSLEEPPAERTAAYDGPGLLRGGLAATYFLVFNTRRPPFDDITVRRAVTAALDRRRIARDVFEGNASPGVTAVPPVIPGARHRTCLQCRYARAEARRSLQAAGVQRLDVWISTGADHERVAREVRTDLAAAGVHVRIRSRPFPQFLAALSAGRPGLFRFGWTLDYPTLDNALYPLFHSTATPGNGGANYGRYAARDVDRLLDRARTTRSPDRRIALLRRAEDLVVGRDQAIVPVVGLRRRTVVSERVRGLVYGPLGTADLGVVRVVDR